jgi:hypothetical protein
LWEDKEIKLKFMQKGKLHRTAISSGSTVLSREDVLNGYTLGFYWSKTSTYLYEGTAHEAQSLTLHAV